MQGFIFEGDLQFSKLFKMTFVPHTEFKGSPAYDTPNVFYSTSFKNYPSFSLQVPSILSILLVWYSEHILYVLCGLHLPEDERRRRWVCWSSPAGGQPVR